MELDKIKSDISKLFENNELFLYSVTFTEENGNKILEVVFDKHGFVDSDEIVEATNIVNSYLDKTDPIKEEYSLSVTSRGIFKDISFDEAKYYLKETVTVKSFEQTITGVLVDVKGDYLTLKDKRNKNINIKANDIEKINISDSL